ncbi:hypothetical protein PTI98_006569 [Pleurotus ostreatus]|nr:hypothetical protein PTI98_006569 [Pleurotus ostreatus]
MSVTSHHIEYSKTSRAKCHGTCNGSNIELGSLRYGQTISNEYGDTVQWRHWGCVTTAILGTLAAIPLGNFHGLNNLSSVDQQKVQRAIALRRVEPSNVSRTPAKASKAPTVIDLTQKKRKAPLEEVSSNAQASSSNQPTLTQDVEEAEEPVEDVREDLYCTMTTNVVGIQYYTGLVGSGEEAVLRREPENKYDRNAIQVKNMAGQQVGHLPRQVAAKLAPLMDRALVTPEVIIREGNLQGKAWNLPVTLKIYAAADKRDLLEPMLIWATPGQRGFTSRMRAPPPSSGPSNVPPPAKQAAQAAKNTEAQKSAELAQLLQGIEKVDDDKRRSAVLDVVCSVEDILELPLYPSPPSIESGELYVNLLKHQSQGLLWCLQHENPILPKKETDKPVQMWQLRKIDNKKSIYYNLAAHTPRALDSPPALGRGGLCADSMGLGKTLTMLALIVATRKDKLTNFSKSTLIVVPLSIMSNWEKQIKDHVVPGILTTVVYYGAGRSLSAKDLSGYDVVITTYQVLTGEHDLSAGDGPSKKKQRKDRSLFDVKWKRVILDEGHNIRNPKTKMARAACALNAERRWVLSGTPIINSPKDLGSMLTFLRVCQPLDDEDFFKRLLLRPLKNGLPSGSELLRSLMSQMCIRRTKEMQDKNGNYLVPLPPVEMLVVQVKLTDEARALYDEAERRVADRVQKLMNSTTTSFAQSHVLGLLTRLRQLALHPNLIPRSFLEELRRSDLEDEDKPSIELTPDLRVRLQSVLAQAIEDNEECAVCFDVLSEPRITPCAHCFCLACITEVISRDPKCPMDRRLLRQNDLVAPLPPTDALDLVEEESVMSEGRSAKIEQLVHLLTLTPAGEKSIVFSQFTSFLDKIAEAFEENDISYVRFDGKMSAQKREETIARFSVPLEEGAEPEQASSTQVSSTRRRPRASQRTINDDADVSVAVVDDNFVPGDDDDDDFVESDDDTAFTSKKKGKGKAKQRKTSSTRVFSGVNPKVMLISLKAGALGLNLTVANNVYLMDPWWQEGIESQAIDRCNRIGQKKNVHVYQLIAENTVESKVLEIQERKKKLIKEAFSGTKTKETQRQKKEARLQDLVELFGVRQQEAFALSQSQS